MIPSKLILGTVQMGLPYGINNPNGKIGMEESHRILKQAYLSGIRILDTAEVYGDAHQIIGSFHRQNPDQVFRVITKIPSDELLGDIQRKIKKYLTDLHVSHLEALMFHSYESFKIHKDSIPQLLYLKDINLLKQLGVSIYTNDELEQLIADESINLIQLPFNLLDNFNLRGGLLKKAKEMKKTIHTRSVFLQGLFFKDPSTFPTNLFPLAKYIKQLQLLAKENNVSLASLCLNYPIKNKYIDGVLLGIDNLKQLQNNIQDLNDSIDPKLYTKAEHIYIDEPQLLNPSTW